MMKRRAQDKPSLGNGLIRASAILFLGRGWRRLRHLLLFFGIGGKQHVMIKGLLSIIPVPIQLKEKVDRLRQPEVDVFLLEMYRAVFRDLMLYGEQRQRVRQFR